MAASPEPNAYAEPLLGVVFDLDGTLVLSDHDFHRMRREVIRVAERHGVTPGHLSVHETVPHLLEAARAEMEKTGIPEGEQLRFESEAGRTIDAIEMEALPRTVIRDGAKELLTFLTEKGYRVGVLTRSSEAFCRAALHKTGLLSLLPTLRTRSAPGPAKPSPEALLSLLHTMGVPHERAVYVGDHLIDAECATRARIRFYGLLPAKPTADSVTAEKFASAGAKAVAPTLEHLGVLFGAPPPRKKLPATG